MNITLKDFKHGKELQDIMNMYNKMMYTPYEESERKKYIEELKKRKGKKPFPNLLIKK